MLTRTPIDSNGMRSPCLQCRRRRRSKRSRRCSRCELPFQYDQELREVSFGLPSVNLWNSFMELSFSGFDMTSMQILDVIY